MNDDAADTDTYALRSADLPAIDAPDIAYRPPSPRSYRPKIGIIGTGGISASHLDAYRSAGWEVAALWNRTRSKAEVKAAEYCPDARIEGDWQAMLGDAEIDVIDVTLHTEHRVPIIEAALRAGKHVLSQKPFVSDLETVVDAVGLGAAIDYVQKVGIDDINRYEHTLTEYAMERLREVPGIRLIGTAPGKVFVRAVATQE